MFLPCQLYRALNKRYSIYIYIYIGRGRETEGRQANAKAREAVDHVTSFLLGREEISEPGIEPSTSSLRFE